MAIYTWRGEEYFVTKDWLVGDLRIPMNVITDAITHAVDDGFDASQIEAYIRDSMTLFRPADTEATRLPSAEDITLENAEGGRPLALVIGDETYRFNTGLFGTLSDLAAWISDTLNQAKERAIATHIAQLKADLEDMGFSENNLTVKIEM